MATYYMLVYCNDGPETPTKFLMGIRNHEGYFFHKKGGGEKKYKNPQPFGEEQTPGELVLPGGTPDSRLGTPLILANTEFIEETGVDLLNDYGVQSRDVNVQIINNDKGRLAAYIVQVKLSNDNFQTLVNQINTNMSTKRAKILAIEAKNRPYQLTMPECPILDDELSDVEVLETGTPEFNTALLNMDMLDPNAGYKYRGWFAEGIVNCVNRIYNLHLDTTFNDRINVNAWVHGAISFFNDNPHSWEHSRHREPDDRRREPDVLHRRELDDLRRREPDDLRRREPDDRHHREPDDRHRREPDDRHRREPDDRHRREPDDRHRREPDDLHRREPDDRHRREPDDLRRREPDDRHRREPDDRHRHEIDNRRRRNDRRRREHSRRERSRSRSPRQ